MYHHRQCSHMFALQTQRSVFNMLIDSITKLVPIYSKLREVIVKNFSNMASSNFAVNLLIIILHEHYAFDLELRKLQTLYALNMFIVY